ncbi:hypothetical protein [Fluviispira multicolorata]|uniref:Uncharacterized protein n=1 Tax=Fluviispira multicolorata TaxID=2654512 RepID=A0A833N6B9_9BACT|nr:hypothetical protein [Fluviispira multicolorata]KAB8033220.1 hypothetical protein GCL57_00555 [Fluviispira multicolorata]
MNQFIMRSQKGQVLLEGLVANLILFLCAFSIIEIVRLLAFKAVLHSVVSDLTLQISHSELALKRAGIISQNSVNSSLDNVSYENEIKNSFRKVLSLFPTSRISFANEKNSSQSVVYALPQYNFLIRIDFIFTAKPNPSGVYMKVNTCLPVLFASFFNNSKNSEEVKIGRESQKKRNCLGQFSNTNFLNQLFWFRIRSSSYAPWPASTQIYEKGFALPRSVIGLEDNIIKETKIFINDQNLTPYFFKSEEVN